jgi:hypothetical protein
VARHYVASHDRGFWFSSVFRKEASMGTRRVLGFLAATAIWAAAMVVICCFVWFGVWNWRPFVWLLDCHSWQAWLEYAWIAVGLLLFWVYARGKLHDLKSRYRYYRERGFGTAPCFPSANVEFVALQFWPLLLVVPFWLPVTITLAARLIASIILDELHDALRAA